MLKKTRLAALAVMSLLGACGGGGSDGDGGGGGNNGSLSLSTSSITFTALPVLTPASQIVSATVTGVPAGSTLYLRIEIQGTVTFDVGDFQLTGANSGNAVVVPRPLASVGMGTHTATIRVTACTTSIACTSGLIGTPQTINVTYQANGLQTTPSTASITASELSASGYSTTVTLQAGEPWAVSPSLTALSVSPGSGNAGSTPVTITLDAAAVESMQLPSGSHLMFLRFTSGANAFTLPVTINIQIPQLQLAAPRVVPAGEAGSVWLRGGALNTQPIGQIRFGATPAASFSVDQPYLANAGHPALTAGTYPISFTNMSGAVVPRSTASLVVVDPLGAPAQVLPYPDARARRVTDLHFDAEYAALVLAVQIPAEGETASQMLRFAHHPQTGWSLPLVRPTPYLSSIALRPDGQGWFATALADQGTLNLLLLCTPDLSSCEDRFRIPLNGTRWTQVAIGNNALPLLFASAHPDPAGAGNLWRYSPYTRVLSLKSMGIANDGLLVSSADGQYLALASRALQQGAPRQLRRFSAGGDVLSDPLGPSVQVSSLQLDGRGWRLLVNQRRIIDQLTGGEHASLPATTVSAVINRASTRAYAYDADGMVHTYDLSVVVMQGQGAYAEVGAPIALAGNPGPGPDGSDMRMALSPDGRTLFLAGRDRVVVQPLP